MNVKIKSLLNTSFKFMNVKIKSLLNTSADN